MDLVSNARRGLGYLQDAAVDYRMLLWITSIIDSPEDADLIRGQAHEKTEPARPLRTVLMGSVGAALFVSCHRRSFSPVRLLLRLLPCCSVVVYALGRVGGRRNACHVLLILSRKHALSSHWLFLEETQNRPLGSTLRVRAAVIETHAECQLQLERGGCGID